MLQPKARDAGGKGTAGDMCKYFAKPSGCRRGDKCSYSHSMATTWRVGGLSNWLFYGLINSTTPIRVLFRVLISLLTTYLLSPPTLQVWTRRLERGSVLNAGQKRADRKTARWAHQTQSREADMAEISPRLRLQDQFQPRSKVRWQPWLQLLRHLLPQIQSEAVHGHLKPWRKQLSR